MNVPARTRSGWLAALALSVGLLGAACAATVTVATPAAATATGNVATGNVGYVRLAHLSPNTPPVDVYLYSFGHAQPVIVLKHVSYGTVSPYETVESGGYTVAMRAAGAASSSKPVLSTTVEITAGGAYTVAGLGRSPGSGWRSSGTGSALRRARPWCG